MGIYGHFKFKCKIAFDDYLRSNPGEVICIKDIAKLTSTPFLQAFTPTIISSFESAVIRAINRLKYKDEDFDCTSVVQEQSSINNKSGTEPSTSEKSIFVKSVSSENLGQQSTSSKSVLYQHSPEKEK